MSIIGRAKVLAAILAVAAVAVACASEDDDSADTEAAGTTDGQTAESVTPPGDEAEADVVLVDAGVDALGDFTATLQVTNHSSKRSNYDITVSFEQPALPGETSALYGTGWTFVENVEPNQSTTAEAISTDDAPGPVAVPFDTTLASMSLDTPDDGDPYPRTIVHVRVSEVDRTSDVG